MYMNGIIIHNILFEVKTLLKSIWLLFTRSKNKYFRYVRHSTYTLWLHIILIK
jgi:hypothetical protein